MNRRATVALVRRLTALRPKRRKLPRPLSLEPIEREYHKAIVGQVCTPARAAFRAIEPLILADLAALRASQEAERTDAVRSDVKVPSHVQALITRAAKQLVSQIDTRSLVEVAKKFGKRTSRHQALELDRQCRAAIGVPYTALPRSSRDHVPKWTSTNVKLIKTVPTRYFARIQRDVTEAYSSGIGVETLAKKFSERHDQELNDSRRIARDQISKLNGQFAKSRQQDLGVTKYTWRSVRDNRTRECHADLDDTEQSWDSPPEGGGTDEDEEGHPGDGILCRCYAEPDFSDLIG